MIHWPCVLKLYGDAELLFFPSQTALNNELDSLIWDSSDRLIDSAGQCYQIHSTGHGYVFEAEEGPLSLQQITQLIQEHEFAKAKTCIIKIEFTSVQQALQSIVY